MRRIRLTLEIENKHGMATFSRACLDKGGAEKQEIGAMLHGLLLAMEHQVEDFADSCRTGSIAAESAKEEKK